MKCPLLVMLLFVFAQSVKLPPNFKKCNRKDLDWKKCVFEAGVDGLSQLTKPFPELNIPNITPMFVPEISVEAVPGSAVAVSQYFKNCYVYGLTNVTADRFEFDFDNKEIIIEGTFFEVRIPAEYKLDGKILLFPITGEGHAETKFKNMHVKVVMKYEEFRKKEKTHLKVMSSDMKIVPELIVFRFDNLFNGDKVLGDNMNKVLNDNWRTVYEDLEKSYTQIVNDIFVNLINSFFSKVSIEEAFD